MKLSRMPRKLKVFQAQFGFYDSVVAAPSQAAALRIWGAHRNLFDDGGAHAATDPQAIDAALALPEVALRRAAGSADPFTLNPRLPTLSDLPEKPKAERIERPTAASKPKASRQPPPPQPPPDRSALKAAEATLAAVEDDRREEEQAFRERRAALEGEERTAAARFADARSRAQDAIHRERTAFEREVDRRK